MNEREYILEIVFNKLSIENVDYNIKGLVINIDIGIINFNLKPSGKNLNEERFRHLFSAKLDEIKQALTSNPVKIIISYNNEDIADTKFNWIDKNFDRFNEKNLTLRTRHDFLKLKKKDQDVGQLSVELSFSQKCGQRKSKKQKAPLFQPGGKLGVYGEMEEVVDPEDVLFVIGDDPTTNNRKNILNQCGNNTCPLVLDISKYRIVKGKLVQDDAIIGTCGNLDCCGLKDCRDSCTHILKDVCLNRKNKCKVIDDSILYVPKRAKNVDYKREKTCRATTHFKECPDKWKDTKEHREYDTFSYSYDSISCTDISTDYIKPPNPVIECPKLITYKENSARCCLICNTDMSYLPKYGTCPKCGFKPFPYVGEEKSYNENLNSSNILDEWGTYLKECNENNQEKSLSVCVCTCTDSGKLCPHCRVQGTLKNIMKNMKQTKSKIRVAFEEKKSQSLTDILKNFHGQQEQKNMEHPLTRNLNNFKAKLGINSKPRKILLNSNSGGGKITKIRDYCEKRHHIEENRGTKPGTVRSSAMASRTKKKTGKYNNFEKGKLHEEKIMMHESNSKRKSKRKFIARKFYRRTKKAKTLYYKTKTAVKSFGSRHQKCLDENQIVPKNMGWLWTYNEMAKKGWKPGAICRPIKLLMTYFLRDYPIDTLNTSVPVKQPNAKKIEEKLIQKPTLHIVKRGGEYNITMRPLKDPKQLLECPDPYENVKPIRFKICKNPIVMHNRFVKTQMKQRGFKKCTCGVPVACCYCRTHSEKERLLCELRKAGESLNFPNIQDSLVLSDTTETESEFDVEFTPPAGLIKPCLRRKPDACCKETQYAINDYKFNHPCNEDTNKIDTQVKVKPGNGKNIKNNSKNGDTDQNKNKYMKADKDEGHLNKISNKDKDQNKDRNIDKVQSKEKDKNKPKNNPKLADREKDKAKEKHNLKDNDKPKEKGKHKPKNQNKSKEEGQGTPKENTEDIITEDKNKPKGILKHKDKNNKSNIATNKDKDGSTNRSLRPFDSIKKKKHEYLLQGPPMLLCQVPRKRKALDFQFCHNEYQAVGCQYQTPSQLVYFCPSVFCNFCA